MPAYLYWKGELCKTDKIFVDNFIYNKSTI